MPVVSDYTALLYAEQNDAYRWNTLTDRGTQTVVTYSFPSTRELPAPSTDPFGVDSYWSFNSEQQARFREALDVFEASIGLRFVEVDGPAMINTFGFSGGSVGGWSDVAYSTADTTSQAHTTVGFEDLDPGTYGFQVLLHEIGHALGLKHPHEGPIELDHEHDTQDNTVMTYNTEHPRTSELGPLDIEALQHLYGDASDFAGWDVSGGGDRAVRIVATGADEVLIATDHRTVLIGRGGQDELMGRQANDVLKGGGGRDKLWGDDGRDKLIGGGGRDRLWGEDGRDKLIGGGGADRLNGGSGNDVMKGGARADTFIFTREDASDFDRIRDFGRGNDRIDLSELGPNSMSSLSISTANGHTNISYGDWDLRLVNYDDGLSASDFIF